MSSSKSSNTTAKLVGASSARAAIILPRTAAPAQAARTSDAAAPAPAAPFVQKVNEASSVAAQGTSSSKSYTPFATKVNEASSSVAPAQAALVSKAAASAPAPAPTTFAQKALVASSSLAPAQAAPASKAAATTPFVTKALVASSTVVPTQQAAPASKAPASAPAPAPFVQKVNEASSSVAQGTSSSKASTPFVPKALVASSSAAPTQQAAPASKAPASAPAPFVQKVNEASSSAAPTQAAPASKAPASVGATKAKDASSVAAPVKVTSAEDITFLGSRTSISDLKERLIDISHFYGMHQNPCSVQKMLQKENLNISYELMRGRTYLPTELLKIIAFQSPSSMLQIQQLIEHTKYVLTLLQDEPTDVKKINLELLQLEQKSAQHFQLIESQKQEIKKQMVDIFAQLDKLIGPFTESEEEEMECFNAVLNTKLLEPLAPQTLRPVICKDIHDILTILYVRKDHIVGFGVPAEKHDAHHDVVDLVHDVSISGEASVSHDAQYE